MDIGGVNILKLLLKTTLIFIVLLTMARMLGNKQMSHLTFFNYITGITIGSIAANMISEGNSQYIDDFAGLIWWCILSGLTGYISLKSGKIRAIIDGQPVILIKRGKIMHDSLSSNHINMDDLSMLLRAKDVFSIKEVEYAILEPDGRISVMKKQPKQHVTKEDMKIQVQKAKYMPSEIISDGKVIRHNLIEFNLSDEWLQNELKKNNVSSVKDVFYAEIQEDGTLFIQEK